MRSLKPSLQNGRFLSNYVNRDHRIWPKKLLVAGFKGIIGLKISCLRPTVTHLNLNRYEKREFDWIAASIKTKNKHLFKHLEQETR